MTTSFPLLKLPLIPLELIIDQLDFLDLLQLSMKSTKLTGILQLLKLSVGSLNVCLTERSYEISIQRNFNSSDIVACDSIPVDTITEAVKIQGKPLHIWKHGRNKMKAKSAQSKLATLETITMYIMSISKVTNYALNYDDAETGIRNLFIWQITTKMDHLNIFSSGDGVTIFPEDLAFILDGISIEFLILKVSCPGFKYQRPIRHPAIYIKCPNWLDFDQLSFGPETITANFYDRKVSNAVLNRLIKDWTEGKNPKLKEVQFTWEDNDPESLAMAREHETRPPKPIFPNRNIEQLKGLSINHRMRHWFIRESVFYEVRLSVKEDSGLNGIHLEDKP